MEREQERQEQKGRGVRGGREPRSEGAREEVL